MIEFEIWAMLHSFSCLNQGNEVFQSTRTSWQFSWTSLNNSFAQNIKSLGVKCAIITKLELEIQMASNHLWKTILHVSYSIAPYGDYMEMTQILETSSPTSKIKIVLCLTNLIALWKSSHLNNKLHHRGERFPRPCQTPLVDIICLNGHNFLCPNLSIFHNF